MTQRTPRILFYFLHLLGVGHVHRAQRLISAFADAGLETDAIIGGKPVPHLQFAARTTQYLPPIMARDATYSETLDENGKPLTANYIERRTGELLKIFNQLDPDLILIEAFPFGRRVVRQELKALLDAAAARTPKPLVVSSVRDILQEKRKPGRAEEVRDLIDQYFDHVLVHSDPNLITLDATYPLAGQISHKLSYTGFVVPPKIANHDAVQFDVIVSAGGGGFGAPLMQTSLDAAKRDGKSGRRWCLATGPNLDDETFAQLHLNIPDHITIVRHLDGLAAHLKQAQISISQCGYNTAMDVLQAAVESGTKGIFVPYDTQGQTEQLRRAELLQQSGFAQSLPQSSLTTERLGQAIERAEMMKLPHLDIDFKGAVHAASQLKAWIQEASTR